jgi:hypothetical protein
MLIRADPDPNPHPQPRVKDKKRGLTYLVGIAEDDTGVDG